MRVVVVGTKRFCPSHGVFPFFYFHRDRIRGFHPIFVHVACEMKNAGETFCIISLKVIHFQPCAISLLVADIVAHIILSHFGLVCSGAFTDIDIIVFGVGHLTIIIVGEFDVG